VEQIFDFSDVVLKRKWWNVLKRTSGQYLAYGFRNFSGYRVLIGNKTSEASLL
jgi:hypothetical protein